MKWTCLILTGEASVLFYYFHSLYIFVLSFLQERYKLREQIQKIYKHNSSSYKDDCKSHQNINRYVDSDQARDVSNVHDIVYDRY